MHHRHCYCCQSSWTSFGQLGCQLHMAESTRWQHYYFLILWSLVLISVYNRVTSIINIINDYFDDCYTYNARCCCDIDIGATDWLARLDFSKTVWSVRLRNNFMVWVFALAAIKSLTLLHIGTIICLTPFQFWWIPVGITGVLLPEVKNHYHE